MIDVFAGGIASRNHFKDKKDLAVIDAAVRKHGSNPYGALVDNDLLRSEAYLQDGI